MGLKISTDNKGVKVVRKDGTSKAGNPYTLYSLMVGVKNGEEWTNVFFDCAFKKGVEVGNKAKILIKDAFVTANVYNGKATPKVFIMDFDVLESGEPVNRPDADGFMNIADMVNDEELPFE